jgi:eukaryotic-like serine/threonine-protein kinase
VKFAKLLNGPKSYPAQGYDVDQARWEKVQSLFHDAAALPESERLPYLRSVCNGDEGLLVEVLSLLEEDSHGASLLDRDVSDIAGRVFDDPIDSLPFREFGPYRIEKRLGEGGMAVVYLAKRKDLGSLVAIKILRDAWLSPARRERFVAEQRTLAQLNHPSIARLYDADTSPDGTPFFVMEYVEGAPLTRYCHDHHCSTTERLQLFRAVCEAVLYAHQCGVIHRDLKPSNILVREDGTVRLLDFGISKHVENFGESVEQTVTGLRLMTPAYASLEQIRGERVGIHTDVYSLGVILYELLCGRLPFDLSGCTPAQVEKIITEHEGQKPSAVVRKAVPPRTRGADVLATSKSAWADLDVLCLTAMHKDSRRRYQSVEALLRDIDHYLKAEPLEARPDTFSYRLEKFVARNRRAVAATAILTISIFALVVFFAVRLAKSRDAALAEAARAQRIQAFMSNLFEGGDAAAGPADNLRVITLLDRGVQEAQSLSDEPGVQAQLYETLGTIYEKLGKLDQADSLLQSAFDKRKAFYGSESTEVADSMIALGQLRSEQGRMDDADHLIHQGLEMDQRLLSPDDATVAKAKTAYGKLLAQRGSYDQAILLLDGAVSATSTPGAVPSDLEASTAALADAHYSAGHYKQADSLYRQLLVMDRNLYGPSHPNVARDLGNLGSVQQDLGYYSEAEKFEREALAISEGYYGKENPRVASDLTMLGRALLYQKKYDQAESSLQQALAIQEKAFGSIHPDVADTLNELGNVASMRDNYDEAGADFSRVADIYRQVYGDHHYFVAIALSNVAYNYLNERDYRRAELLFRDVVRRFTETLSADNVNTGIARIKLGRTLLRQNRFSEAQQETMAGYLILANQANPTISYLQSARKDLALEYDGLNEPQLAAKFRAELVAEQKKVAPGSH